MKSEEIQHLKNTVKKGIFNRNDTIWKNSFIEYTVDTKNRIGMGCNSCYKKVLDHIDKKYQQIENSSRLEIIK